MSVGAKLLKAAAGNAGGGPVYVDDVFSTFIWDGTGSSHAIDNGIDLSGEGGLVWIKSRSHGLSHSLYDTERGNTKIIQSNSNGAENTNSTQVTSFNSNGFTMGTGEVNYSGYTYCGWTFRKQPGFFDVVTYTGNGSARTISHNLGSVPGMIIVKRTDSSADWQVYHRGIDGSAPEDYGILLNSYTARVDNAAYWNDTAPTSSVFSVGTDATVNANTATYVAYLFAHDAQDYGEDSDEAIIKCDKYTGDGSTSNFVNVGFEPQWVFIKKTTGSENWGIFDSIRGVPTGSSAATLLANEADAESSGTSGSIDFNSTGFTLTANTGQLNTSGTYIYVAIRRPHKPASEFAATDLFSLGMGLNASAGEKVYSSTFPVDFVLSKQPSGTSDWYVRDRLRPFDNYLNPNDPRAASSNTYENELDHMDGVYTTSASNTTTWMSWLWKRAPGFFDVVAYKGTGSAPLVVNHNLGATPELMIFKDRGFSSNWWVWHPYLGTNEALKLNSSDADASNGTVFNNYTPNSTTFSVWTETGVGANGSNHIAYLFATVAGISKVSKYTGTGSDINVDCGFSAGARFVLIKRIDATGDWYVYDSVRGIVAGNDPYIFVNSNAGGVTNTDYIDPLSSGFTITSSAPAALNASSGEYLFLAIA